MTTVPVLFGYVRLREADSAKQLPALKRRIRRFASQEGFTLAEILLELERGGTAAFNRLLELMALRPGSRAVVPTLEHLAELAQLQRALSQLIERETGSSVIVLTSSRSTTNRQADKSASIRSASSAKPTSPGVNSAGGAALCAGRSDEHLSIGPTDGPAPDSGMVSP